MNRNAIYLLLLLLCPAVYVNSQVITLREPAIPVIEEQLFVTPTDTLSDLYLYYFGKLDSLNHASVPMRYIETDARYYRLFLPLTHYNDPIREVLSFQWQGIEYPEEKRRREYMDRILPYESAYEETRAIRKRVNRGLLSVYLNHPELIVTTEERIKRVKDFKARPMEKQPRRNVVELFRPGFVEGAVDSPVELEIRKPNFWTRGGSGSLQLSQNYISDNWYKGGESNNNLISSLQLSANYNDKNKVQWDNLLEAKVGFSTLPSDTLHKYLINADLFRVTSKLGIQAASNWYYTLSGEFNTQFFHSYKANDPALVSAFLAPANLIFTLGMDYKLKKERIDLSVVLSPAAYNFRYVGNSKVDETKFGLKEGRKTLNDLGSKVQSTMTWKIIPSINWESRIYYFTSYKKVEAEWESTFNFVLNKYLSTKLFFHARFDDSVTREEGQSFFQFQELLSFGINYSW